MKSRLVRRRGVRARVLPRQNRARSDPIAGRRGSSAGRELNRAAGATARAARVIDGGTSTERTDGRCRPQRAVFFCSMIAVQGRLFDFCRSARARTRFCRSGRRSALPPVQVAESLASAASRCPRRPPWGVIAGNWRLRGQSRFRRSHVTSAQPNAESTRRRRSYRWEWPSSPRCSAGYSRR